MFCKKCGKMIDEDSVFCRYCGSDVSFSSEASNTLSSGLSENAESSDNNMTSADSPNNPGIIKKPLNKKQTNIIVLILLFFVITTGSYFIIKQVLSIHLTEETVKTTPIISDAEVSLDMNVTELIRSFNNNTAFNIDTSDIKFTDKAFEYEKNNIKFSGSLNQNKNVTLFSIFFRSDDKQETKNTIRSSAVALIKVIKPDISDAETNEIMGHLIKENLEEYVHIDSDKYVSAWPVGTAAIKYQIEKNQVIISISCFDWR